MDCSGCIVVVLRNLHENANRSYIEALKAKGYRLVYVTTGQNPVKVIESCTPIAVCFQYDYPDLFGLADLRLTKQLAPSVPLLMITQAHSEQLAVWAFRTRVWDYFVQPVDTARLLAVLGTLSQFGKRNDAARSFPQLRNTIPPEARLRCGGSNEEQSILERALSYLDANLHSKIVQADVAQSFGLSTFQFSRLFKRLTRITFQEYLISRRIEEAKRLLENPRAPITDVCFTVGFQDLSYFTRVFQRYVGMTPSRYRQLKDASRPTMIAQPTSTPEDPATAYYPAHADERQPPQR